VYEFESAETTSSWRVDKIHKFAAINSGIWHGLNGRVCPAEGRLIVSNLKGLLTLSGKNDSVVI
jgi:hypothetical protein